jgi:hypothetical protein
MFILRRITPANLEINTNLGDNYVLILRERTTQEFKETIKSWLKEDVEDVYGLITFNDSDDIMPLFETSLYFIMTSDGKTFSNVSKKL